MLETNETDPAQMRTDKLAWIKFPSMFRKREVWALELFDHNGGWITANRRKILKLPLSVKPDRWVSSQRTIVIPYKETGFTVFEFMLDVEI
ncbi:hypothetical protein K470DRAFT_257097 [Piedraia hortae CBS 480.64]|uniref:Uncharacterized protein n=1 Tax=Piedraia hortae CBS 480.64 TaxID=1314780 RepID=A0A6A7C112_9PEZI|nr:hypothetical protein K470DRAFT_257097 [Piedraia hortae CBS 480.64]